MLKWVALSFTGRRGFLEVDLLTPDYPMKTSMCSFVLFAAAVATAPLSAQQAIQFDFGPTVVTGADLLNSPGHTQQLSSAYNTWNQVQVADVTSGLLFGDNTAATGVGINTGITTLAAPGTLTLGTQPTNNSALGTRTNAGVYAGTSVGKDGIFGATSASTPSYVGAQITGMNAGTYTVFVTSRNTNSVQSTNSYAQVIYAGTSASAGDFNFSGYLSPVTLNYASTAGNDQGNFTSAWSNGQNYASFTLTILSGEAINVAVSGTSALSGERRGFINSIQIIDASLVSAIPEPSTYAALAGLVALGAVVMSRRRKA
jgi:hypothetical protein